MNSARKLANDTMFASAWMGVRISALVIWLWAVVSQFSVSEFGLIASFLAINSVLALLVQAGIPYLFFSERHTERSCGDSWPEALGAILVAAPIAAVASALVVQSLIDVPLFSWWGLLGVAYVDITSSAIIQIIALRGHSQERLGVAAALPASLVLARTCAALLTVLVSGVSGISSMAAYLVLHVIFAGILTYGLSVALQSHLQLTYAAPRLPRRATLARAWRYTLMGGSSLALGELDKPLVTRVFGLEIVGHYALAYRIVSTLATPATALGASMIPRWSKFRASGDRKSLAQTYLLVWLSVGVGGGLVAIILSRAIWGLPQGSFGLYPEAWPWAASMFWLVPLLGIHQINSAALLAVGWPLVRTIIDLVAFAVLAIVLVLGAASSPLLTIPVACIVAELVAALAGTAAFIMWWHKERCVEDNS